MSKWLADLPAGDEVRLWLYGAARRILANQRRGTLRRTALTLRLREELSAYAGTTFDQAPEGAREAFARLSDDDRELLSLVGWEELSPTEIAKVLGCSRVAVRQRLHRARKRLAPDPGPGLTPGAREMLTQIMDMAEPAPRARRTRWRPLIALPIAAALAGAGWSATVVLGATPAAALDIKDEGDHYLIEARRRWTRSSCARSSGRTAAPPTRRARHDRRQGADRCTAARGDRRDTVIGRPGERRTRREHGDPDHR
ncbi:RNA polymerase sigma factor [Nonomuraea sp. NPDC049028]|uniref:RNA polymerase sigma factor n=1 Tax=Nonomuraea sp. NPDC049028 TaxID=3364348 RepID=UPI003712039E